MLEPTCEPDVFIIDRSDDVIVYRRQSGRTWSVRGVCDRRGHCMVGAVVYINGVRTVIASVEHLKELCPNDTDRLDSELDVPVGPGFSGCCPFVIEVIS